MMINNDFDLLNYVSVGVCIINSEYKILRWNNSLENITNIPESKALNKYLFEIYPEFNKAIYKLRIQDIFDGGAPTLFSPLLNKKLFSKLKNKESLSKLEIIVSALPTEDPNKFNAIFCIDDKTSLYQKISTYKELKDIALEEVRQRKAVEEALKQADKTKDKFISIIAHDIKNPLGVIQSISDYLLSDLNQLSKDDLYEFIESIFKSSKNLLDLLNNLLTWARSQSGRIQYNPEMMNLFEIVKINFELQKNIADKKEISLINKVNPTYMAYCDENMINTILRNLLSNAIKFTRSNGSIIIDSKIVENGFYEVRVIDNGIGISQEDQQKLFKIGESHTTIGTGEEKGTGLGLILCKEFVNAHGGKIRIESEIGVGSTFLFTIPIFQK